MHDTFFQRCLNDADLLGETRVSLTAYKRPHHSLLPQTLPATLGAGAARCSTGTGGTPRGPASAWPEQGRELLNAGYGSYLGAIPGT